MSFTSSQREAITCRDGSVLVSAGAGSGKTRVLTERLMEYIDPKLSDRPPEDLDRFLIITFTRAAAGELKARIAGAIAARLQEDPQNAHLRLQMLKCRSTEIGTIHSFCANLLRRYADLAGISPGFRILEDERSERMRQQALERVLEASYEEAEEDFLLLADSVGIGRDDRRLADLVLKLHGEMQSHARPELWAQALIREGEVRPASALETRWGRELLQQAQEETDFHLSRMIDSLVDMSSVEAISRAYADSFSETRRALQRLSEALDQGWDAAAACLPIPFPRINKVANNPDPALSEELKARREDCKKAMGKLANVFSQDEQSMLDDWQQTAPAMATLLRLALKLEDEFSRMKHRQDLLDFNDLEHLALRVLLDDEGNETDAAREIAAKYREVMVDEYQDVSRVQDRIFHAVSREGKNLFFVGDVKQSIYRFRLADPGIFTEKSRRFGEEENSRGERLIHLQENFRSHPTVIDAVNAVFRRCMTERLGDIDYCGAEELIAGRPDETPGEKPELLLIDRGESEAAALELEARQVAAEIRCLLRTCRVPAEGGDRPLRCGDIAILLRAANTVGGQFRRVLLDEGIPVAAGFGGDFYSSTEVTAVYSMLCLLDQPHQDIPLLSLLRSPCFSFSADRLSLIRAKTPDTDFYTALCASEDPESRQFLALYRKLRSDAPDCSPKELIERIIEELDLYTLCSAMPDGERRLGRLDDLRRLAENFSRGGEIGLHRFVSFLKSVQEKEREPQGCAIDADAVQLLSIHRSKGLEYPVVFCCGLGRLFNRQDLTGAVLIHPELGLGPKVTDSRRKLEYPTAARHAVERRLKRESLSEELRLLYVAMTRARERLILTACVKNPEKLLEETARLQGFSVIPAPLLQSASAPLPWLLPAALDGSALRLRRVGPDLESIPASANTENDEKTQQCEALDRLVSETLLWSYPWPDAVFQPSKITATELKAAQEPDPEAASVFPQRAFRPGSPLDEKLSAAERGTAMHLVLQQIDFRKTGSLEAIREELCRLTAQEFLTPEEAATVDTERILLFFASPLGTRMRRAEHCEREFRFSLLRTGDGSLSALLQGSVDCFFEEDGGLVVVDYKTDRVETEEELRSRAEYYRIQLDTYALALERIFSLPVREKILCFLRPGKTITL
ncbi:MAG: UvrD-helicase domain-containing protein [Oscillospiraceae bacterium]|nr:UvrD-helicase domain-containing protein [Oscillospiraceae bacterium]